MKSLDVYRGFFFAFWRGLRAGGVPAGGGSGDRLRFARRERDRIRGGTVVCAFGPLRYL